MELIDHLKQIGFTTYEAKAYVTLLRQANITGYELAKLSGIPASKIYEVINRLQEKDMLMALATEPKRYVPFPPAEVLARLQTEYANSFDYLHEKLDDIYEQDSADQHYIWNITGAENVLRKARELLSAAEHEVFLSIWAEELDQIVPILQKLETNGITIHMVLFNESEFRVGKTYRHGREHQIRQERKARRLSAVIDDQVTYLAHFMDGGLTTAVYTLNRGLVLLTKDYIIHDIYTIRMQEMFGEKALEIFREPY